MTPPSRSVVLHGHFYQPPREDPWTEEVPEQPGAAPFHDWNERVAHECYRPVTRARVLAADGSTAEVVNCLEWMSFDFGPTLLWWLEGHDPETYAAVLAADRAALERTGHGGALAMPFHHPILPLSDPRDRVTEIRWGVHDFRRRFGREPEGMWLPETAVDAPTLDALAAEGVRFTVVAPHQVDPVPADGRPVRWVTSSGREIALFVYDGELSHGVAFGRLLSDGVGWAEAMSSGDQPLRSVATDGETFGHHHTFAEMALAKAITRLRDGGAVRLESYASVLAREGATAEAALVAPTAWSCAHGVERWRSDCGCRAHPDRESSQAWRAPLRAALERLAAGLHGVFERDGVPLFGDPWAARDDYGRVAGAIDPAEREAFARERSSGRTGRGRPGRAFELLEMERNALRLFTSCAWFFDDVAGVEARQVLRYAARALELAGPEGRALRAAFRDALLEAPANDPDFESGADVFDDVALQATAPGGAS